MLFSMHAYSLLEKVVLAILPSKFQNVSGWAQWRSTSCPRKLQLAVWESGVRVGCVGSGCVGRSMCEVCAVEGVSAPGVIPEPKLTQTLLSSIRWTFDSTMQSVK